MKRLICLLLIMLLTLSLIACDVDDSTGTEPLDNQTQNNGGTQNNNGTSTNKPEEPELVMPDAPTEDVSMMEYNPAYKTLEDITADATFTFTSFVSTSAITANSVTEFSGQGQADAFFSDFANIGDTDVYYHYTVEEGYRNFFLANTEYSEHLAVVPKTAVYNTNTDTLYILLDYNRKPLAENHGRPETTTKVAKNTVASYHIIGVKAGEHTDAEHIVFVAPENKPLCREDINVSVVSYDAKYQELQHFEWNSNAVSAGVHSFPSTKAPTESKAMFITSEDVFMSLQQEYNDITTKDNDWIVMEPGLMWYKHRSGGTAIENSSSCDALLNILVASPELDPYSAIRHEQPRIVTGVDNSGKEITTMCCAFYDEATQTVYIYLGYNGMPHTQYESFMDKDAINNNAKGTYVLMSIDFDETMMDKVQNVVIVLPDSATVPSN